MKRQPPEPERQCVSATPTIMQALARNMRRQSRANEAIEIEKAAKELEVTTNAAADALAFLISLERQGSVRQPAVGWDKIMLTLRAALPPGSVVVGAAEP